MNSLWYYLLFACDDADSDADTHDYRQMRDVEFEREAQKEKEDKGLDNSPTFN